MKESTIKYQYSLDLLKRFNGLVERDELLRRCFSRGGWNLLQTYQAALFSDMKLWSREERLNALRPDATPISILKTFGGSAFAIAVSILAAVWAICVRKRVLIFSGDKIDGRYKNDFRIDPIYAAITQTGASFIESVHTLADRNMRKNFFIRRRLVLYQEAIDMLAGPLLWYGKAKTERLVAAVDVGDFSVAEQPFIRQELKKYILATLISRARMRVWKFYYKVAGIQLVLSIDDTRHYNELVAAAAECDIPSYAIQHGHFTKYHPGWLKNTNMPGRVMRPSRLVVWSDYWKHELLRLRTYFAPEELVVGGERWALPKAVKATSQSVGILIPYEKDAPKAEVKSYIEKFLLVPGLEVIFKLRADEDKQMQLEEYGLVPIADRITIVRSAQEVLPRIGIAAGIYSTFLYDMVVLERPVLILESSMDYGLGMVENGLADFLKMTDDPKQIIANVALTSPEVLAERRKRLTEPHGLQLEDTLRGIINTYVKAD